jgi:hypothetical protein
MKTILDQATRDEIIGRINTLDEKSTALWGTMDVYQMAKHCTLWEEMILENKQYKQTWIGWLVGRRVLKSVLKDETPLRRNTPTMPVLRIREHGDITDQKQKWIARLQEYASFSHDYFMHPFFGKMTREQIGYLAYKQTDHHLRQFNA